MTPVARAPWTVIAPLALVACIGAACKSSTSATPKQPVVFFAIDAPLCSSTIPVRFSIDSAEVGADTFVVNYGPPHTTSRGFTVSVGEHTLSARTEWNYVWPDKRVTLAAGETFTDSLPFYCS